MSTVRVTTAGRANLLWYLRDCPCLAVHVKLPDVCDSPVVVLATAESQQGDTLTGAQKWHVEQCQ